MVLWRQATLPNVLLHQRCVDSDQGRSWLLPASRDPGFKIGPIDAMGKSMMIFTTVMCFHIAPIP
jgi:hypothetical protein